MRIVVTGASGFLGGFVLHALKARGGLDVIGVSRRAIDGLTRVSDYGATPEGDLLIHLAEENNRARAAQTGPAAGEQPGPTLTSLLAKSYRRVLYASSGIVYGDADSRPHTASDPAHAVDAYSSFKRQSELAVLDVPGGVVVRLANLYGPGMSRGNVISAILGQIPGEGPLRVTDTRPVRDFLWVDDAAEGFASLALLDDVGEGRIFNLGTRIGTSIGDVARASLEIAEEVDRAVIATGSPQQRESNLILDYADTYKRCGWKPRTALRHGLARLLGKSNTQ